MGAKIESFPTRVKPQIIPMGDTQVKLVWGYSGATGELGLKSNVLFVDPESSGAGEDLLLPAEGKSAGMQIFIANTGGENVVVKEDSDTTTIVTIAAGGATIVACDGTSWHDMMPASVSVDFGGAGLQADVVAESTAAAGVTVDGLLVKDGAIAPVAGGSAFINLTAVSTGEADIVLKDNLADALAVREASNAYLTFTTTNDAERITTGKLLAVPTQVIDMADTQVALIYGTAGAGQVKLTGQVLFVDASSSGTEDLLLPPEASSTGVVLDIMNTGGESIVVKEDSDTTTICTIATGKSARVACNGTTWYAIVGA